MKTELAEKTKLLFVYLRNNSKRLFLDNLGYKLASLLLSTLVWYFIHGQEIMEINLKLNVKINVKQGLIVEGGDIQVKDVTLRGPRVLLSDTSMKALETQITVPEGRTGRLRYRIDKDSIKNWDQRASLTIHDAYVDLFIDYRMTRVLPIKELIIGTPADGFQISRVIVEPKYVTVTGPRSIVSRHSRIQTEAIDVDGLKENKTFEVNLASGERLDSSNFSVSKVTIKLEVTDEKVNRTFQQIPIDIVGSEFIANIKPKYVDIVLQGTPAVLGFLTHEDLSAFIELRGQGPGKILKDIQVKIPNNTTLIETIPNQANVEIYSVRKMK